jgi:acetoin utilization protein AcuC
MSPRVVVLGGGGYNPWTTARLWSGMWGLLAGHDISADLPPAAQAVLAGLDCDLVDDEDRDPAWLTTLIDAPNAGPIRPEIVALIEQHPLQSSSMV